MKWFWPSLVLVSLSTVGVANPIVRTVETNQALQLVDIATNTDSNLWSTPFATDSLAIDLGGSLYSADPNGVIFNVTTPIATPVGPTGFTQIGDLDFAPGGLWGFSNASQSLFFYDLGSTSVTYSVNLSSLSGSTVTGVAYDPSSAAVYLSANAGFNADQLYVVPNAASSATFVGNMAHADAGSYISDIDFDGSGTLYAMTWFHRDFYSVNPLNGATSLISNGPHRDVTGLAIDASVVPEPGSLLALGGGLVLLRRRQSR